MSFGIDLAHPRHGWIDVAVRIDDERYPFMASAVLNDPIRELAELALFMMAGARGQCGAVFWLEPAGYELRIVRDDALTLWWMFSLEAYPQLGDPELLVGKPIDAPRAFASEILRSLRDIQPMLSVGGDSERWPYPFPSEQIEQLSRALRADAGTPRSR